MNNKQWNKLREDFADRLSALTEDIRNAQSAAQDYFDDRSERWQESDKGSAFQEFIDSIETGADAVESAIDELPEFPD